jgi:hypothetical protein
VIDTFVPGGPLLGEKFVIDGAWAPVTVKLPWLVSVPSGLVTEIWPVVAPPGTVAVSCESFDTLKLAATPLNLTALVPVKPEPLTVTSVPGGPLVGLNELITGTAAHAGVARPTVIKVTAATKTALARAALRRNVLILTTPSLD